MTNENKQTGSIASNSNSSTTTTTTTNSGLPGLEGVQVIVSKPSLVKENSSKITKK